MYLKHTHVLKHTFIKSQTLFLGNIHISPPSHLCPLKPFNSSSSEDPGKWLTEEDPTQLRNDQHRTQLLPNQGALSRVKVKIRLCKCNAPLGK